MSRAAISVLIAIFLAVSAVQAGEPGFCNGLNCPSYTVLKTCKDFEIRNYTRAQWVSAKFEGPGTADYDRSIQSGFMDLFNYITGANIDGQKIDMTAPVLTNIYPGSGPNCNTTFTISFFVPFKYQFTAPKPTNPNVFLRTQDSLVVAVRSFGGYANSWDLEAFPEFLALGTSLQKAGISFSQTYEWTAVYNGPYTIFNRHNEVWYAPTGDYLNAQC